MHPIKILKATATSFFALSLMTACGKSNSRTTAPPETSPAVKDSVQPYLTTPDRSKLLERQPKVAFEATNNSQLDKITVDSAIQYQTMDGFGFCLTDGSARLISEMAAVDKKQLLGELFGHKDSAIGISYLRVSIGASDLSDSVYTYDDMPEGQTDKSLKHFSIAKARIHLIPLLKEILRINPSIKILGSPWSAPSWMKSNASSKGGSLLPQYYESYAQYFVRYIKAMQKEGITIDAITPQNEPLNPDNNPSLYMTAGDQRDFIKNNLGPAFKTAGLSTKIQVYDHNADHPDYPMTILSDPDAAVYVDGSAFHLYNGDISALSEVHDRYPDKNLYFTEQYTPSTGSFGGDLSWHITNLIVGATRNWSRNVLEWNLAADPNLAPHTPGGCTTCLGALTIDGKVISRNPSYYIIAHASRFVPAGSVRISSGKIAGVPNVAFLTPEGRKVCIAINTTDHDRNFCLKYKNKIAPVMLSAGTAATYVW